MIFFLAPSDRATRGGRHKKGLIKPQLENKNKNSKEDSQQTTASTRRYDDDADDGAGTDGRRTSTDHVTTIHPVTGPFRGAAARGAALGGRPVFLVTFRSQR